MDTKSELDHFVDELYNHIEIQYPDYYILRTEVIIKHHEDKDEVQTIVFYTKNNDVYKRTYTNYLEHK